MWINLIRISLSGAPRKQAFLGFCVCFIAIIVIHFGLQLGRNWKYIYLHFTFSHSFVLFYAFVGLKPKPKPLLLAINCSRRCLSFSTRIVFKRRKQTNWSRSSRTHMYTRDDQRKSLNTCGVDGGSTHWQKINAYIPVWRLKSRDDETKNATKTETTKHAKLAQVHPVPQTCSSSNSSSRGSIAHSRTRKKWFQYWADNRMVMKKCYSFLGYKTTARTLFATIFISIQFVVWFCADFTQLIFLRGRQWVNLMNIIDKENDLKWNTISRRDQIIFPTRERHFYRFTHFEWWIYCAIRLKEICGVCEI